MWHRIRRAYVGLMNYYMHASNICMMFSFYYWDIVRLLLKLIVISLLLQMIIKALTNKICFSPFSRFVKSCMLCVGERTYKLRLDLFLSSQLYAFLLLGILFIVLWNQDFCLLFSTAITTVVLGIGC